jgi:hypothetical protein
MYTIEHASAVNACFLNDTVLLSGDEGGNLHVRDFLNSQ